MNRVVLIGRLTRSPELRYTPGSGTAVTTFTLAVDRRIKKEGQAEADFINCVAFGKTAETIAQYVPKGRLIGLSGSIRTGSYEAKDGTKRYTTDVYLDEFQFLEKSGKNNNNVQDAPSGIQGYDEFGMVPESDGDIPF